jgi:hypothetical protein
MCRFVTKVERCPRYEHLVRIEVNLLSMMSDYSWCGLWCWRSRNEMKGVTTVLKYAWLINVCYVRRQVTPRICESTPPLPGSWRGLTFFSPVDTGIRKWLRARYVSVRRTSIYSGMRRRPPIEEFHFYGSVDLWEMELGTEYKVQGVDSSNEVIQILYLISLAWGCMKCSYFCHYGLIILSSIRMQNYNRWVL